MTQSFAYSALATLKRTAAPMSVRSTPRRRPSRVDAPRALFLDFDGVLHPTPAAAHQPTLVTPGPFGWLAALAELLRPHPDVVVVVHSTWRYTYDDEELKEMLYEVGERFVGSTPPGPRYESIQAWLRLNNSVTSYRILDDDPDEFPRPLPAELIVCNPEAGVTASEVVAALRKWLTS